MEIKIDIPEGSINNDNPMINISSDHFYYCNIDSRFNGFQSDYQDGNLNQKLQSKLEDIANIVDDILKEINLK